MKKNLQKSFMRDEKILKMLKKENKNAKIKKFVYTVKILKQKYLQMISNRYISTLLSFKAIEIKNGIDEIKLNFDKKIVFKDKLLCLILTK